jgi:hypothetical protein
MAVEVAREDDDRRPPIVTLSGRNGVLDGRLFTPDETSAEPALTAIQNTISAAQRDDGRSTIVLKSPERMTIVDLPSSR